MQQKTVCKKLNKIYKDIYSENIFLWKFKYSKSKKNLHNLRYCSRLCHNMRNCYKLISILFFIYSSLTH